MENIQNEKKKVKISLKTDNKLKVKELNFFNLKGSNSKVACHSKPKIKEIPFIVEKYKVNFIYTLQHKKENPGLIEQKCKNCNINWNQLPLEAATIEYFECEETIKLIIDNLLYIYNILKNEEIILYIHCAAGVHRTGTILYSILRMFGESKESALKAIKFIRLETFNNVGEERINYAEEKLIPNLLQTINC